MDEEDVEPVLDEEDSAELPEAELSADEDEFPEDEVSVDEDEAAPSSLRLLAPE